MAEQKPRVRVVGYQVQPVVFVDDGENLTAHNVQPVLIPARDWETWAAGGWRESIAQLRASIEGSAEQPEPAGPDYPVDPEDR